MLVELKPIDSIRPCPKNPRVIPEAAVSAVADSISRFGFRVPLILAPDGELIAGHTRLLAARKLGMTEVPAHTAHGLSPAQCAALRLADNKLHELSSWNDEALAIELRELEALDVDISLLGFSADELAEIMAPQGTVGLVDPDDVPAPPDEATTKRGDLITLGYHRLLCGDSSSAEDVDRLLGGATIHMVNTDPPFNVKVEPRGNAALLSGSGGLPSKDQSRMLKNRTLHKGREMTARDRPLQNDFLSDEEFQRLLAAWFGNIARVLAPGGAFYIWGGSTNCGNYPPALKANHLFFHQGVIWVKEHPALTRRDFMSNHEWCFYGWREGAGHHFYGPSNIPDVWSIKKISPQAMIHLTEKPVELAARAMAYSSKPGECVLDLFGGSGSTLIAAEQQGRRAFVMEIDPLYCDVIIQRWEGFTGKKAERRSAGR